MKTLIISSAGLKNISLSRFNEEDDFILIFGNQQIPIKNIFAEFISPIVSHLHQSDPTIRYIKFDDFYSNKTDDFSEFTKDIFTDDIISLLQQLSSGYSIEIDNDQSFKLRFISIILGNEELFRKINELFPSDFDEENLQLYLKYTQYCYHFSRFSPDFDFSSLLNYISQNFYLIQQDDFLKLSRPIQYSIISNPNLQIKSEDSLLDTVCQIINNSYCLSEKVDEFIDDISFLEQIEFSGLSEFKPRNFLSTFDFNGLTSSLWNKLSECFFVHSKKNLNRIESRHSIKQNFEYIENQTDKFKGIIHYLTEKCHGNVDEKGVCSITASSMSKNFHPRNVVDYSNFQPFASLNQVNSWILFDFKDNIIQPSFYSIRSWSGHSGTSHLKNWVIEGSNTKDDNDWRILDSRNNENIPKI